MSTTTPSASKKKVGPLNRKLRIFRKALEQIRDQQFPTIPNDQRPQLHTLQQAAKFAIIEADSE